MHTKLYDKIENAFTSGDCCKNNDILYITDYGSQENVQIINEFKKFYEDKLMNQKPSVMLKLKDCCNLISLRLDSASNYMVIKTYISSNSVNIKYKDEMKVNVYSAVKKEYLVYSDGTILVVGNKQKTSAYYPATVKSLMGSPIALINALSEFYANNTLCSVS